MPAASRAQSTRAAASPAVIRVVLLTAGALFARTAVVTWRPPGRAGRRSRGAPGGARAVAEQLAVLDRDDPAVEAGRGLGDAGQLEQAVDSADRVQALAHHQDGVGRGLDQGLAGERGEVAGEAGGGAGVLAADRLDQRAGAGGGPAEQVDGGAAAQVEEGDLGVAGGGRGGGLGLVDPLVGAFLQLPSGVRDSEGGGDGVDARADVGEPLGVVQDEQRDAGRADLRDGLGRAGGAVGEDDGGVQRQHALGGHVVGLGDHRQGGGLPEGGGDVPGDDLGAEAEAEHQLGEAAVERDDPLGAGDGDLAAVDGGGGGRELRDGFDGQRFDRVGGPGGARRGRSAGGAGRAAGGEGEQQAEGEQQEGGPAGRPGSDRTAAQRSSLQWELSPIRSWWRGCGGTLDSYIRLALPEFRKGGRRHARPLPCRVLHRH